MSIIPLVQEVRIILMLTMDSHLHILIHTSSTLMCAALILHYPNMLLIYLCIFDCIFCFMNP